MNDDVRRGVTRRLLIAGVHEGERECEMWVSMRERESARCGWISMKERESGMRGVTVCAHS